MEIKKINLQEVLTCNLNDSVKNVSQKLRDKKERRVFVVDDGENLKGIITTTDLVYKILCEGKIESKASDVMTEEVKSIDVQDNVEKALEVMNKLETFVCPVTKEGKIVGVITYHDLIKYLNSTLE